MMDIPFPETTPRFVDSKWFSADNPCDEEAELTALEQLNQSWLSSVGQQFKARAPLGKTDPEPMEECESEEEDVHYAPPPQVHYVEYPCTCCNIGNPYNYHPNYEPVNYAPPPPAQVHCYYLQYPCTCDMGQSREYRYEQQPNPNPGNDESDESEESHDEDEEEELQQAYPPARANNEQPRTLDLADSSEPNMSDQSTLWP